MVVVAIDQGDVHVGFGQPLGRPQSAESGANDDDVRSGGHGHTSNVPGGPASAESTSVAVLSGRCRASMMTAVPSR